MNPKQIEQFKKALNKNKINFEKNARLKRFTTFQIGGPAKILIIVKNQKELVKILEIVSKEDIPYIILGGGSNVLISDKGINKVVIINKASSIKLINNQKQIDSKSLAPKSRLKQLEKEKFYSFHDLDYKETGRRVMVKIDSGTNLTKAISDLIKLGITGLQWYAGIPGTIGGAIYNNIHGGTHFLSEVIEEVEVYDFEKQTIKIVSKTECDFDYDFSRFHNTNEVILSGIFNLYKGDTQKALWVFKEWTKRKIIQPKKSAGSIWQNLDEKTQSKLKLESPSWGFIIDKVLKLKGTKIGGAQISLKHAGFIENVDNATSQDVYKLIKLVEKVAQEKLNITPKREIILLGDFSS